MTKVKKLLDAIIEGKMNSAIDSVYDVIMDKINEKNLEIKKTIAGEILGVSNENTELDEKKQISLNKSNKIIIGDDSSEIFANIWARGNKGDFRTSGPTSVDEKNADKLFKMFKLENNKNISKGSTVKIYKDKKTNEKFKVSGTSNGKGFNGTDYIITTLKENLELDEGDYESPVPASVSDINGVSSTYTRTYWSTTVVKNHNHDFNSYSSQTNASYNHYHEVHWKDGVPEIFPGDRDGHKHEPLVMKESVVKEETDLDEAETKPRSGGISSARRSKIEVLVNVAIAKEFGKDWEEKFEGGNTFLSFEKGASKGEVIVTGHFKKIDSRKTLTRKYNVTGNKVVKEETDLDEVAARKVVLGNKAGRLKKQRTRRRDVAGRLKKKREGKINRKKGEFKVFLRKKKIKAKSGRTAGGSRIKTFRDKINKKRA